MIQLSQYRLELLRQEKISGAINPVEVVCNFEEQVRIVSILRETNGRISGPNGAAFRLGLKRSTLLDRMKKFGIDAREVRSSQARETQVAYL